MPGTRAELASWLNLAALANVAAQPGDVLVIHVLDVICAELADLAPAAEASATAATAATSTATGSAALTTIAAIALTLRAAEAGRTSISTLTGVAVLVCRVLSISHASLSRFYSAVSEVIVRIAG